MKRYLSLLLFISLLIGVFMTGCTNANDSTENESQNDQSNKVSVVATIFPGYDFAREIAGEHADVHMLLPPGSESHSYEPTPQDIIKIQNCDIFIYVGGHSDTWVKGILETMDTSSMKIIPMMELVEVVTEEIVEGMEHAHNDHDHHEHDDEHIHDDHEHQDDHEHDDGHDHSDHDHDSDDHNHSDRHEHEEYDEHVWTSPVNARIIAEHIGEALAEIDADNKSIYNSRLQDLTEKLNDIDSSFKTLAKEAKRKTIVFGDRFPLRYFADEYDLDYYAAYPGCASEVEANAKTVTFLINKIKEENIPVVFHIELSDEKMANTICEETGAQKLLFHSCHNITKSELENGVSYVSLMEANIENLKKAIAN